jgi:hypothetical protein
MRNKTITRSELSNLRMVAGNEKKYDIVIINGMVREWVGIGWIDLRVADAKDHKAFPTVVD